MSGRSADIARKIGAVPSGLTIGSSAASVTRIDSNTGTRGRHFPADFFTRHHVVIARCLLDVRGLDRIDHLPAKPIGPLAQHRLVHDESIRTVGDANAPPGRADLILQPDVRRQAREEQTVAPKHPPHLFHQLGEMRFVIDEVQHGARRSRRPCCASGQGKMRKVADLEVLRRQLRRQRGRKPAHPGIASGSASTAETLESVPEKIGQVASVAAAGVEHPAAPIEPAAEQLIEQIDIDVAELGAKLAAGKGLVHRDRVYG